MGAAAGHPDSQSRPVPLFLANGVLQAADGVLYLALNMVGLAFTFCFCIAGGLARPFFGFAFCLLGRAFDAILINHFTLAESCYQEKVSATGMFPAIAAKDGDQGASQILHCHVANLQRSPVPNSFSAALGARGGSIRTSARAGDRSLNGPSALLDSTARLALEWIPRRSVLLSFVILA